MKATTTVLALALAFGTTAMAGEGDKKAQVDSKKSEVKWTGEKVTGTHWGYVNLASGTIENDGKNITGGAFELDMTSISVKDLEGEYAGKLEGHLKSPDFFNSSEFNTATFVITNAKKSKSEEGNYLFTGDLTIKGITHSIQFPANVEIKDNMIHTTATMKIDRTKWDIRYGSGSFFDDLGDKTIYDEFEIALDVTASN